MNYQLASIKLEDDLTIQYPLNFLVQKCDYFKDLQSEDFDLKKDIGLPYTSKDFNLFLEFLQTEKPLDTIEETITALTIADFLRMNIDDSQLYLMVCQLEAQMDYVNDWMQLDQFVQQQGYSDIHMASLIHALENLTAFKNFEGLSFAERYDQLLTHLDTAENATAQEIVKELLPILPHIFKWYILILTEHMPANTLQEKIDSPTLTYLTMLLKIGRKPYLKAMGEEQEENTEDLNDLLNQVPQANFHHMLNQVQVAPAAPRVQHTPTWWERLRQYMPF